MKKLTPFVLSGFLLMGGFACQNPAKTGADAPNNTNVSPTAPDASAQQTTQNDAQSEVRKDQLNSDIRAREQRNNATGGDADRAEGDLKSEVRSKLEANIPKSRLAVDAEDGNVTVSGTVANQQDLSKIEPLAKEIKGVTAVVNKATVAPAKSN